MSEVGFQNFTGQPGQWIEDFTGPTANPLATGHRTSVNFDPWEMTCSASTKTQMAYMKGGAATEKELTQLSFPLHCNYRFPSLS